MHSRFKFAGARPGSEQRPAVLLLVTTLVLTAFFYWLRADTIGVTAGGRHWTALTGAELRPMPYNLIAGVVLGLVPLLVAWLGLGLGLGELGMGTGNWRRGALWLAVGVPVAILAGWLSAGQAQMRAVYPLNPGLATGQVPFVVHALTQLFYYAAWEILFRGVLLQGLTPSFGFANANMIQTALSVIAHFGRPGTETCAAIPAGLAFGGVARYTGSVWYVVVIHWVVGTAQDWFIVFG